MDVSSDAMNEKHEEAEDSLEDLLIFPTRKGLHQSMKTMEACFVMEAEMMKQMGLQDAGCFKSTTKEHQRVLNIPKNGLNSRPLSATCESN
jgi:hypothetical protein